MNKASQLTSRTPFVIDAIKINHWLNARKITTPMIAKNNRKLVTKIIKKKNFSVNYKEIKYLTKILNISSGEIIIKENLPEYIFYSKKKILQSIIQFKNFQYLINNSFFNSAVLRTIYFGLVICVFTTVFSFLIAILLNEKFVGKTLLRVMIVLPWAVPSVVSGVLWGQMFHADTGFLNALLYQSGIISEYKIWLADPLIALHIIAVAEIWKAIPFMTLFFLSGLQSLPSESFEAASVDGANVFQRFFYILFPLMLPIAIPLFLIQFVLAMKSFDTIFVLTRGGPGGGTTTLNYFIYKEAFETFNLGRASAAAYVLLIITLAVVLIPSISKKILKFFWGNK